MLWSSPSRPLDWPVTVFSIHIPALHPSLSGAAPSSTAFPWWSTKSTARVHPASTRHLSGETPPGIGCPQLQEHSYPEAHPRRALTACSASRFSSSTRQLSHGAPPLIESCQMGPGKPASAPTPFLDSSLKVIRWQKNDNSSNSRLWIILWKKSCLPLLNCNQIFISSLWKDKLLLGLYMFSF